MPVTGMQTFAKGERLCGKLVIDHLFSGRESRSVSVFPLRAVYQVIERVEQEPQVGVLISVPKRCLKRAVKRNRVKRQLREAFRKNKQILLERLVDRPNDKIVIAFLWQDLAVHDSQEVEKKVITLLSRISERL